MSTSTTPEPEKLDSLTYTKTIAFPSDPDNPPEDKWTATFTQTMIYPPPTDPDNTAMIAIAMAYRLLEGAGEMLGGLSETTNDGESKALWEFEASKIEELLYEMGEVGQRTKFKPR